MTLPSLVVLSLGLGATACLVAAAGAGAGGGIYLTQRGVAELKIRRTKQQTEQGEREKNARSRARPAIVRSA
ncbi:MAG TPA: hypothetical protein VM716_12230 [Gemmatimonadales bacterium]|nr:hypothetical protein [Gemmatimonadales bacterium]